MKICFFPDLKIDNFIQLLWIFLKSFIFFKIKAECVIFDWESNQLEKQMELSWKSERRGQSFAHYKINWLCLSLIYFPQIWPKFESGPSNCAKANTLEGDRDQWYEKEEIFILIIYIRLQSSNLNKIINMAFIICGPGCEQIDYHSLNQDKLIMNIKNNLERFINFKPIVTIDRSNVGSIIHIHFILQSQHPPILLKFHLIIDISLFLIQFRCHLMKNSKIFKIINKNHRHNIHQHYSSQNFQQNFQFQYNINFDNGVFVLRKVRHYTFTVFDKAPFLWRQIHFQLQTLSKIQNNNLKNILQQSNETNDGGDSTKKSNNLRQLINNHIQLSSYDLGLSENPRHTKYPSQGLIAKRQNIIQSFKQLLNYKQQDFISAKGCLKLYSLIENGMMTLREFKKQIENTSYFQKHLDDLTPKGLQFDPNCYIFNQIKIHNKNDIRPIPTNLEGGFSQIVLANLQFSYVFDHQTIINSSKDPQNRLLLIKSAKTNSRASQQKIAHEKKIVSLLNLAVSSSFIRYYHCEDKSFIFKDSVMMEYNPYSIPLIDYLILTKNSLSLKSKLIIIAQILNAIRFLSYYKIVHMDLNPRNILISHTHEIKIIDFGQAYQELVCSKMQQNEYNPGYTLPFCPPQVFNQTKTFTSAQDIYSLGIIIYYLLTDQYPFFPNQASISALKQKTHYDRFLLAPEGLEHLCNSKLMALILQFINRCIHPNEQLRPIPIWCTIILKQMMAML